MCHRNKVMKTGFAILLLIAIWQIVYWRIDNDILLASPFDVGRQLWSDINNREFWICIFCSMKRIGLGFLLAFLIGFFAGILSYMQKIVKIMIEPVISVIKSIPVASFVVILLIWTGSESLSVWISFLVVLPGIYESTLSGLKSRNETMVQLADISDIPKLNRWFYIYRPAIFPYLINASRVTVGMAWKSGVAAELIGNPVNSLGEKLYMAKITLDTQSIFSWTIVIILLSTITEYLWIGMLTIMEKRTRPLYFKEQKKKKDEEFLKIRLCSLDKSYGEHRIFSNFTLEMENHTITGMTGASGKGKTTLLNMIAGVTSYDAGKIRIGESNYLKVAYVFQQDIFYENADAVYNCMFWSGKKKVREELGKLLPEEALSIPVKKLSGGMRRRVSIVSALLSDAQIILMDEPFTGLDDETKRKTADYILVNRKNRFILFTTHQENELTLLNAEKVIRL